jgi:glycosyltransferase involved in cell wall biosynthesis
MRAADVLVGQPRREVLSVRHPRAIYDLFDPNVLELEELVRRSPSFRLRVHRQLEWGRLSVALRSGWRLIAATPRQRDFYLGVHASRTGDIERWPDRWLEIPFGAELAPERGEPAIPPGAPVAAWGGGTWEWLDPELAVRAAQTVNAEGVPVRLLFLGTGHPNAIVEQKVGQPIAEAPFVLRNDEWVPYRERGRWLAGCRLSIMLHGITAESELSIRTRLFDAIAFGIPVVATRGGWAADLVESERLGIVVEPESLDSVAAAIRRLVEDDAFHAACVNNLERIRPRFAWSEVVRPLVEVIADR